MNATEQIDQLIAATLDWRGGMLAQVRKCILGADPEIIEDWKWMGSPAWSRDGLLAVANPHKNKVKITFAYGAGLADPDKLFNGDDNGNTRRSIDIFEADTLDEKALTALVRAAIVHNQTVLKKNAPAAGRQKA